MTQEPQNDARPVLTLTDVTLHAASVDTQPGPYGGTVTVAPQPQNDTQTNRFILVNVETSGQRDVSLVLVSTGPTDVPALLDLLARCEPVTLQPALQPGT